MLNSQLSKLFAVFISLLLFVTKANAALTFVWKGTSTTWASASSWTKSGTGGTSTYPGEKENTDIVQIGTTTYTSTTNQPKLAASVTLASLEFGDNGGNAMTLTINTAVTLTVTGAVKLDHNNGTGGITTTITGTGTANLTCGSFTVGDNTAPPAPSGEVFDGDGPQTFVTTLN